MNGSNNGNSEHGRCAGPYTFMFNVKITEAMRAEIVREAAYRSLASGECSSASQVIREIVGDYFERMYNERAEAATEQLAPFQYVTTERNFNG